MVLAFRQTNDGSLVEIPHENERLGDPTLAGTESARKSFYGGELAAHLNLKLLHVLKDSDLWVYARELIELESEVILLLQNLRPEELDYWGFRLRNIKAAIARAKAFGECSVVYVG